MDIVKLNYVAKIVAGNVLSLTSNKKQENPEKGTVRYINTKMVCSLPVINEKTEFSACIAGKSTTIYPGTILVHVNERRTESPYRVAYVTSLIENVRMSSKVYAITPFDDKGEVDFEYSFYLYKFLSNSDDIMKQSVINGEKEAFTLSFLKHLVIPSKAEYQKSINFNPEFIDLLQQKSEQLIVDMKKVNETVSSIQKVFDVN